MVHLTCCCVGVGVGVVWCFVSAFGIQLVYVSMSLSEQLAAG